MILNPRLTAVSERPGGVTPNLAAMGDAALYGFLISIGDIG